MSIVKKTIKQTAMHVLFGETVLTRSNIVENSRNFAKIEYVK